MSIYYSKLDWPTLPVQYHQELIALSQSATTIRPPGQPGDNIYHHYRLPEHIEKWGRDHLPIDDRYHLRIERFFGVSWIMPHIDRNGRIETCNYVLSPSGPTTRWFDKDKKIVESVVFPQHQWYRLKVDVMHDVINLSTERIAFTIHRPLHKLGGAG